MPRAKYQSLQTIRTIGHLKATGSLFLNGVSNKYDTTPPKLLKEILPPKEMLKFEAYMEQLNIKISQYWPCLFAFWCGYLCSPCTLGMSFLVPRLCVAEAEEVLRREIRKINQDILGPVKLEMRLEKGCCDSHLLI